MTMDASNLDVIVLNWKTPEMSADCARAAAASLPGARIIIVDNGSGDDSPAKLRQLVPGATIVENDRNLGFGGGMNAGIRAGRNPFVLILNSDARPVGNAYQVLLDHCASDDRIGAVTPQTLDTRGQPVLQMAPEPPAWRMVLGCLPIGWRLIAANVYSPLPGPPASINWLPGLCVTVLRRSAIDGVGAFDPGYFLGWEEWDLTRRLRAEGWQIALHPGAEIIHEGHGSTPKELEGWRSKHGRDAMCHHLRKYHGRGWYTLGRLSTGVANAVSHLRSGT
jgi:N-acetylglucosaminyl-diphospho-decaprenol L-rhamnosyltransferase